MSKRCREQSPPGGSSAALRGSSILGVQAAADDCLAQQEASAQPKQLAAPAPGGLGDVARGGARVPPQRRVVLRLAREAESVLERGEHGLVRT